MACLVSLAVSASRNHLQKKQEKVAHLEAEKGRLSDKLSKAEQGLRFSIPKHIGIGLQNVQRIVAEERIRGFHGAIYDLITLNDPKFTQAVEVRLSDQG